MSCRKLNIRTTLQEASMLILALDTSTMLGGAALMQDDLLIAESRLNVKITHSERVMTEIDAILSRSGLSLQDVDIFGIAAGPGSFTGLRVGLSTIKGLVYATGKKLVSVSTLEALAWNVPFSAYDVCPILDARKKQVYTGIFSWSGAGFSTLMPERATALEDLLEKINVPTVFLGDGVPIYRSRIEQKLGDKAIFAPPHKSVPAPANTAYLCVQKARREEFEDPIALTPAYLRKSEAELKLKKE
ncbi:MAG: tRNA (adenosine(37)-N6)-threonylcarbamoyltransferase complex dimerization subunit type 1 TsaB [Nitrospirae bacterium]|nr:MAG: tRNA (adenosine(37)-N6)-threonylcarbamoyltransferase complex dimerization subunit type 1 TsaB [Nitrospirota bacterium]